MSTTRDLHHLLRPASTCEVVDVGANPIDGAPPYARLLSLGLCRVTGFEPQPEALAVLRQRKGPNETYLDYAIADGTRQRLRVCRSSGMTSLLEPSRAAAEVFPAFKVLGEVTHVEDVETRRLDDVAEIGAIDFLKMDVQGGELAVLQHGATKLGRAVVVQAEVSFVPLYEKQPLIGDINHEMRRQGFTPHCFFPGIKTWCVAPMVTKGNAGLNQLLDGDLVYLRDLYALDRLDDEQLKQMALLAHDCYRSFDVALRCIDLLEKRRAIESGAATGYLGLVREPG